jgi:hypothetical protein
VLDTSVVVHGVLMPAFRMSMRVVVTLNGPPRAATIRFTRSRLAAGNTEESPGNTVTCFLPCACTKNWLCSSLWIGVRELAVESHSDTLWKLLPPRFDPHHEGRSPG